MLKKKNMFFALQLVLLTSFQFIRPQQRLSDFDFGSASVLPFFIRNNMIYVILSREGEGSDKGTYDDFGGSREPHETHPLLTAAHEFFEEAMLKLSIGFSLKETRKFIDIKATNTQYIVAFARNVAYITDFSAHTHIFNTFYAARHKLQKKYADLKAQEHTQMTSQEKRNLKRQLKHYWAHLEKDRIAIVEWNTVQETIINSKYNSNIQIIAQVLDPSTLTWNNEHITLRPYFVKKLRPFFMNQPYHKGMNEKIRFYDIDPTKPIITPTTAPADEITTSKNPCIKHAVKRPKESWATRTWNWIKSYSP